MTLIQAANAPTPQEIIYAQSESRIEYVHGQLVEKPVHLESTEIEGTIYSLLRTEAIKTRTVRVFTASLGYRCFPKEPKSFRKPDVSVVHSDRIAHLPPRTGLVPLPPDLAVDVLSPGDLAYDVGDKIQEYLGAGVGVIWIVEPNTRSVSIYRADGSITHLRQNDEITGETFFPSFKCNVAEFFVAGFD
ncbi:MAG TPA: Uma2 family endonuclease [Tepidisphaeraceae bacterium]|jgi:Uma2 family endonuclease|nr:Uma2 family endonuclease [Tepidisphaeraceae bacterium]